ncbi:YaiI/YqxD family protein [Helicovermis profundi]|uniref:UPF0178 protein HLPR_26270 n=1 Tax=Helicovermis profundi TaxID=3065157 RepID=A0AAU9E6C5_9FIRM|nr:YaiI/YqxD family protein [Clostridia bacterium S502]
MKIWVDADGCPVVKITIEEAKKHSVPLVVVKNHAVRIEDDYAKIVTVDVTRDAADYYIVNHMEKGDLVITQDNGLSAMALAKDGKILNQNGRWITNDNIELILESRHISQKERMKKKKSYTKFKKREKTKDDNFRRELVSFIENI